jgi:hypothetical protein
MRWAVELPAASGGTGPTVTVDAESWKSALTEARGGRGLTKFRVAFDEDGAVRVHDLVTNERFSLSPSSNALAGAPSAAPIASAPVQAAPVTAAPVTAAPVATAPAPVSAPTPSVVPPPKSSVVPQPGPTGRPSTAGLQAVVPPPPAATIVPQRPSSATMAAVSVGPVHTPPPPNTSAASVPAQPAQPAPQPTPSIAPAAAVTDVTVPSPGSLFFARDREAAASNGLTYRERLIAVPPETSVELATMVARAVWAQLRQALIAQPSGKFISIAVFDHVFKSRPERPPIVVLGWKDWRGDEPEITVSRPSATSIAPPTTSIPPNSFAPPAPSRSEAPAQPQPSIAPAQPIAAPAPTPEPTPSPPVASAPLAAPEPPNSVTVAAPPKHTVAFSAMPEAVVAHLAAAATTAAQPAAVEPPPPAEQAPALLSQTVEPLPLVAPSAAAIPLVSAPSVPPPAAQPVVALAPPSVAPPAQPPVAQHTPSVAPPAQPVAASYPPPASASVPPPARANAGPAVKKSRHRGDDLLSEAFDALSDMAFLSDSTQATDFAAQVAKDLLHTPFVAISMYDIDKHEIAVECCDLAPQAKGRRARVAKGEMRSDVMLRGLPVVTKTWEPDALIAEAPLGPALFAAICLDRRLFGVLEVHREVGEHGFEHDEEGAASYIASQLAQFLADHSKRVGFQEEKSDAKRR